MIKEISKDVLYIGVDDPTQQLFESQYHTPDGMCYNSYVILDEKVAVMDTSDSRTLDEWKLNLTAALNGRQPDYLVVHHHGVLKARILKWFAIPFSSRPRLSELSTMTHPSWVALQGMVQFH